MLHADFLGILETNARNRPDRPVFLDACNDYLPITYRQLRTRALRLALALADRDIRRGGYCAVDLGNSAAFVYALAAAAYGGFSLVVLDPHLAQHEKRDRARELYQYLQCDSLARLEEETILELLDEQEAEAHAAAVDPNTAAGKLAGQAQGDTNLLSQAAQRGRANADDKACAVVLFAGGTHGRPKAASLTWGNVLGAAAAANARLCSTGKGRWQLGLPLYHTDGFMAVLRSILNGSDFVLYRHFDPYIVLRDARHFDVTHIVATGKMLQDMLDLQEQAEAEGALPELAKINAYTCVLLSGAPPNTKTLKRAAKAKVNVLVGYGLTETSSCVAVVQTGNIPDGLLGPLPGYELAVLNPDADGMGSLAVKGPGVFAGYLNAQAAFTPDGFFITADTAQAYGRKVRVFERSKPEEIDHRSRQHHGGEEIQIEKAELWHVKLPLKQPIRGAKATLRNRETLLVRVTDTEDREGVGECAVSLESSHVSEAVSACERFLEEILLPTLLHRPFLYPRDAARCIQDIPTADEHPQACAAVEAALWDLYGKATKRSICTLIGGRVQVTEPGAIRETPKGYVPGSAIVGVGSPRHVVLHVKALVEAGYSRITLKVAPGRDVKTVAAVRNAFPDITLALDAGQAYKDTQTDTLRRLDSFDIAYIKDPLRTDWVPRVGPQDIFERLARLQDVLSAQVCLDESWNTAQELYDGIEQHPEIRCVSIKIAKFGGVQATLDFYEWTRGRGIQMVVGDVFDTGVSSRLHAALCTLPGIMLPSECASSSHYVAAEVCRPAFACEEGAVCINPAGYEYGLGCELDEQALQSVLVRER